MSKIKKTIASYLIISVGLGLVLPVTDVAFAAKNTSYDKVQSFKGYKKDAIIYIPFIYNKELKHVKSCLNILGFTDSKGKELKINGYYDRNVDFALSKFLKSEGFKYFNKQSRDLLFEKSENFVTEPEVVEPEVVEPEVVEPEVVEPEVVEPEVVEPEVVEPEVVEPEVVEPEIVTPDLSKEIIYDVSTYSEELEYVKLCLNNLGITDHKDRKLANNGYFDHRVEFALSKFLQSQGFEHFSEESRDTLFKQAASSLNYDYDSGFNSANSSLESTVFIYSDVANIDSKWDPFYSMSVLNNFENIVTSRPDQMSYNAKKVMDTVKANANVFGYINLGPNNPASAKANWKMADLDELKVQIDEIADSGWHGVFIDQFGYDWGETRERQNIIIDYAHNRGLSIMANAWVPKDVLGSEVDKRANPEGLASHLNSNDWSLVESFFTDGDSYRADSSYIEKYLKAKEYSDQTGVKISALSYKRDSKTWEQSQSDIETSYVLSHVLGFDGWWFARWDNSNKFLYGKEPDLDLGAVIKPLALESKDKYVAETENYIIEYFSNGEPSLNLIKK